MTLTYFGEVNTYGIKQVLRVLLQIISHFKKVVSSLCQKKKKITHNCKEICEFLVVVSLKCECLKVTNISCSHSLNDQFLKITTYFTVHGLQNYVLGCA